MRIGIDARFYGTENTGLGRYTQNVLDYLPDKLRKEELVIFMHKKYLRTSFPKNVHVVEARVPHYSFLEQIFLPFLIKKHKIDLYLSFHFNVPLFIKIPFIVTIHDLIKTHFTDLSTTTRSKWLFQIKRIGYDLVIRHAIGESVRIIVPTNTVRNDILADYDSDPSKIRAIHEAPDPIFLNFNHKKSVNNQNLPTKYLLYVGNAYPHKNLLSLLKSFVELDYEDLHLVIVAKDNEFLRKLLLPYIGNKKIKILSNLKDKELVSVYHHAKALIMPSLMEGYGLPGLEAMILGTPVIASDIPVFREVYKDNVTYFDPLDVESLSSAIKLVLNSRSPIRKINLSRTWKDVVDDIAEVIYESSSHIRSSE